MVIKPCVSCAFLFWSQHKICICASQLASGLHSPLHWAIFQWICLSVCLCNLFFQTFPTQPCADQLMEFSKQLTSSPTDSTPPALPTPVSGNSQFMNFISDQHPIAALTGAAPQIPQLSPVTHPMTPPPSVPSSFSQVEQYWNHVNVVDPAATAAAVGSLAEAFWIQKFSPIRLSLVCLPQYWCSVRDM